MSSDEAERSTVSRRSVLGGAGAALIGGLVASQSTTAGAATSGLARGTTGTMVVEFRGRIAQSGSNGQDFSCVGYLTRVNGLTDSQLFASSTHDETTALFTASSVGQLVSRVLDQNVHLLDVTGSLTVYRRSAPGASWTHPASFSRGKAVATYTLTIQDVLSVFAPSQGMLDLTADMVQTAAHAPFGAGTARFGAVGDRLRLHGSGLGELVDPATLNAQLEIAGSWTAVEQPGG